MPLKINAGARLQAKLPSVKTSQVCAKRLSDLDATKTEAATRLSPEIGVAIQLLKDIRSASK